MIVSQVIMTHPVAQEYRIRSKMTLLCRLAILSSAGLGQTFQKFYTNGGELHLCFVYEVDRPLTSFNPSPMFRWFIPKTVFRALLTNIKQSCVDHKGSA